MDGRLGSVMPELINLSLVFPNEDLDYRNVWVKRVGESFSLRVSELR